MENIKIGGSLARNARFFAPTCLVSSLWFSCGVAVSMGEVAKSLLCQGFKFGMYWAVGSVRLAVCKDMTRVGSCCRWKVVVWTHTYFTKCRLYIGLVLRRQTLCRLYIYIYIYISFSRIRSKGSRFTLGVWGLRVCSLDVAFVVATVRARTIWPCLWPMGSSAEVVLFGGFRRLVASFRVAGVALRDIQTCSGTCRKSFCVAGAILLRRFQKMCCSFRGRRSTLDVSIVIFRGRRSTLDVSCCVFFVNRIGRAASSGDKVQIPWQAWHFVRCGEN